MYKNYESDNNATIEMRKQMFQEIKNRLNTLQQIAQKEESLYALCDLSADLSDLRKKYSLAGNV